VVRVEADAGLLQSVAAELGIEAVLWKDDGTSVVAAAPPYLVERLEAQGIGVRQLYPTIAEWHESRIRGDAAAEAITPEYQSGGREHGVRIAVVDTSQTGRPQPGYSEWLGDHENVLMRNDTYVAYVETTPADEGESDIDRRERYAKRGHTLAGFFTPEEFSGAVERFFPGRRFDAGARVREPGRLGLMLAEGAFHSYQETLSEFMELAASHSDLARLVNLGTSYEGRQIFALKVSRDPATNDPLTPDVLITGCHHAREWISVEPPVYFANQFLKGYSTDDSIRHLVDRLEIWIVPIVNPDGLTFSQGSPNLHFDGIRLWRKNRRPIGSGACNAGTGVDLNRNYDFKWRLQGDTPCPNYRDDAGGSDFVENELYRGPEPNSELEVKALNALTDDPNLNFRARIDYHNFSELILFPWGYQSGPSPDDETLSSIAQRMSDLTLASGNRRYNPQRAIFLYQTTGTSTDYAYAVTGVPAAFTVEVRPSCCEFGISESEIGPVNRENWAGVKPALGWAAGPPILEAVNAYQSSGDGSLTKLVYSSRWVGSNGSREKVIDLRFPRIEPGRIQLRLQFSSPMETTRSPSVMLGRGGRFDELVFAPAGSNPWSKTIYEGDTWAGEAVIPVEADQLAEWQLSVSAVDSVPLPLDAKPATVADYRVGTNTWNNYEDAGGAGWQGGTDREHLLPPTSREDDLVLQVGAPRGAERFAAGDVCEVAWTIPTSPGFIPTQQEIWLSTDGGFLFAPVVTGLPPTADRRLMILPQASTTRALIRVFARGLNTTFGDSPGMFTIGTRVGSAAAISRTSSELIEQSWTDIASGAALAGPARLVVNTTLTNHGSTPIANPFLRVSEITRNNVLLSRAAGSFPGIAARQYVDAGGDGVLLPGESTQVQLHIGLVKRKKFLLSVEVFGVPGNAQGMSGNSVGVWQGKPRSQ
jgi:carboxypeptidase T